MTKTRIHTLSFVFAATASSLALAGGLGLGLGGHAGGQIGAISHSVTRIQPLTQTAGQQGATGAQGSVGVDVKAGHGDAGVKHGELVGGVAQAATTSAASAAGNGTSIAATVVDQIGSAGTSAGGEAGATGSAVTEQTALQGASAAVAKAGVASGTKEDKAAAKQPGTKVDKSGRPATKTADRNAERHAPAAKDKKSKAEHGHHGKAAPSADVKGEAQAEVKAGVQAS